MVSICFFKINYDSSLIYKWINTLLGLKEQSLQGKHNSQIRNKASRNNKYSKAVVLNL